MELEQLNAQFAIKGALAFNHGPGGLTVADVDTSLAKARVSTYAGQVLSFRPKGETEDLLFVSEHAYFQTGKAIKGGIPICWPWFGPDPEGKGGPGHGFVRASQWEVLGSRQLEDGAVLLRLGISDNQETRAIWPHSFRLVLEITIGKTLGLTLVATNREARELTLTQAFHTYFAVGDIGRVKIEGLQECVYIDKLDGSKEKRQQGSVIVAAPMDRIYTDVSGDLGIDDAANARRIVIRSQGSRSAVTWNPWIEQSAAMGDFGDQEYKQMVCVETANAGPDRVMVPGNGEYRLSVTYGIEHS